MVSNLECTEPTNKWHVFFAKKIFGDMSRSIIVVKLKVFDFQINDVSCSCLSIVIKLKFRSKNALFLLKNLENCQVLGTAP